METQYDLWLKAEKQKIHDKHEEVRQKLNGEAFCAGFDADYWNRNSEKTKQQNTEITQKVQAENVVEQAEINEFMRLVDANWTDHVNDVMGNK